MKKQIFFSHVVILLIAAFFIGCLICDLKNAVDNINQANSAMKARSAVTQKYADAVEHELIQAWMDVCLFKTDADMSDDYDAQYKVCECVVANNMNKLVEGL